jgi:hypothetical protein
VGEGRCRVNKKKEAAFGYKSSFFMKNLIFKNPFKVPSGMPGCKIS